MTPAHDVILARSAPAETLRLLAERRRDLIERGWLRPARPDPLAAAVRADKFDGVLWIGPTDEAVGLAHWQKRTSRGVCAELYVSREYALPAPMLGLLEAAERSAGGPLVRFSAPAVDLPPSALAPALEPKGWRGFERWEMRFPPDRPVPPVHAPPGLTTLGPGDEEALAALMAEAYSDWPLDPAYFGLEDEHGEDPQRAVHALLDGTYGRTWWSAAFGIRVGHALGAATLVNDFDGPLLAEVMVAPAVRRRGYASALLARSVLALRAESSAVPRLAVSAANLRARAVYERFGFVRAPMPPENVWVAFGRVGRPELTSQLPRWAPDDLGARLPESP